MSESQPVQTADQATFVCECKEDHRKACRGEGFDEFVEPFYDQFENKMYCILHYPADKDLARFERAIQRKRNVENYNFQGIWFPTGVNFQGRDFRTSVDFSSAVFNGKVSFEEMKFPEETLFKGTEFKDTASFSRATFNNEVTFESARFCKEGEFNSVTFNAEARFLSTFFSGEANFKEAIFNSKVFLEKAQFIGSALFDGAKFTKNAIFSSAIFNSDSRFVSSLFEQISFQDAKFNERVNFGDATFTSSATFFETKFKTVDFQGLKFVSDTTFEKANFQGRANFNSTVFAAKVSFANAVFDDEVEFGVIKTKGEADFGRVKTKGEADFRATKFNVEAIFSKANFHKEANFDSAEFHKAARFNSAIFAGKTYFAPITFRDEATFQFATFKDNLMFGYLFKEENPSLNLQKAIIEKPERISFHYCWLKPEWFLLVDPRKFEFSTVEWCGTADELTRLKSGSERRCKEFHITYRQLATNAEENHRYAEASEFRFASLEARRLEKFRGFVPWRLDWWYWLASCYGERVGRAFMVFVAVIILFTVSYTKVNFEHYVKVAKANLGQTSSAGQLEEQVLQPRSLGVKEAILYSLNVSILQKPEPKPFSIPAKLLVWLETVLGPAQAALLALAVRRRFMR